MKIVPGVFKCDKCDKTLVNPLITLDSIFHFCNQVCFEEWEEDNKRMESEL